MPTLKQLGLSPLLFAHQLATKSHYLKTPYCHFFMAMIKQIVTSMRIACENVVTPAPRLTICVHDCQGNRFCVIHGDGPSKTVSFYTMHRAGLSDAKCMLHATASISHCCQSQAKISWSRTSWHFFSNSESKTLALDSDHRCLEAPILSCIYFTYRDDPYLVYSGQPDLLVPKWSPCGSPWQHPTAVCRRGSTGGARGPRTPSL